MHGGIWKVARYVSMMLLTVVAPASVFAQESEAETLPAPPAASDSAQEEDVAAARDTYLAPLRVALSDEATFVDTLESMADLAIVRLETIQAALAEGTLDREANIAAQAELRELHDRLGWLCEAGLAHFGENARVRNLRGNIVYDYFGKHVEGVKEWHTAISLDSKFGEPYNNLGMHYFHVGRYPLGFQNMDKALDLEPNNPDFCFNMAQNYLIFGPQVEKQRGWPTKRVYKEAMKLSKRAVKNAPNDYQLLEDYAVNFLAARNFGVEADWKDAAQAWQAAREKAPDDVKRFYTWLNEGRAWKYMNKRDDARRCFDEALKLMPDSDVAKKLRDGLDSDA